MTHNKITQRQCFFLLFLFYIGNLVTASGAKGKQSGWILLLIVALLSIPVLYLYTRAAKERTPGRIFLDSLGVPVGGCLTVIYGMLSILLAGDSMRLFADFIVINDLNDAGAVGNTALLTLAVLFLLNCRVDSLGKAAWLLQPAAVFLILISVMMTGTKMEFQRLLPLFSEKPSILLQEGIASFAAGSAASMLPLFSLNSSTENSRFRPAVAASVSAFLLLAVLALRDTAVLGFPAVSMFRFPSFIAAGMMRHSEIFIAAAFVLSQPFRTALCLRYAQVCLAEWRPRWRQFYAPVLLALAVLSGVLSWSSEQVRWRTVGEVVITVLFLAGPVVVLITDAVKARKSKA